MKPVEVKHKKECSWGSFSLVLFLAGYLPPLHWESGGSEAARSHCWWAVCCVGRTLFHHRLYTGVCTQKRGPMELNYLWCGDRWNISSKKWVPIAFLCVYGLLLVFFSLSPKVVFTLIICFLFVMRSYVLGKMMIVIEQEGTVVWKVILSR